MGGLSPQKLKKNSLEYLVTRLPRNGKKLKDNQANQKFLNLLGQDGWRLIEVTDRRIILVR